MGVTTAADLASLEDGDLRKAGLNIVQTRKLRAAIEVGLTMFTIHQLCCNSPPIAL